MSDESVAPWNFSWIVDNELAAMSCPKSKANVKYVINQGIKHLVTLSPETLPSVEEFPEIKWNLIPLEEFEAPEIEDVVKFLEVCEEGRRKKEAVGVHCRMGLGRTGVMAACYLVYFQGLAPERAINEVRRSRPGSIETYRQECAVLRFRDYIRTKELFLQSPNI